MASPMATSNFSVLSQHDEQLLRLGMLAEKYFAEDPNTCLLKLRQLTESLAQLLAARTGLFISTEETQYDLLRQVLGADLEQHRSATGSNARQSNQGESAARPHRATAPRSAVQEQRQRF
ncbi:MAG: hypothetical protein H6939_03195 [Burkholderiales bacterium]|nr:hypothetical protein [Burkholderiales bacterium]HQU62873.1 hypothetical protein [Nitrosomonas sp.]